MPFDALVRVRPPQTVGDFIEAIPLADLQAYTDAEAAKHPGSMIGRWLETHDDTATDLIFYTVIGSFSVCAFALIGFFISWLAGAAVMEHGFASTANISGVFAALVVVWLAMSSQGLWTPFKGAARWEERHFDHVNGLQINIDIPTKLVQLAREIEAQFSTRHSCFTIGELKQNNVILDPYLIFNIDGHQHVLGIWNDDGIVRIATRK